MSIGDNHTEMTSDQEGDIQMNSNGMNSSSETYRNLEAATFVKPETNEETNEETRNSIFVSSEKSENICEFPLVYKGVKYRKENDEFHCLCDGCQSVFSFEGSLWAHLDAFHADLFEEVESNDDGVSCMDHYDGVSSIAHYDTAESEKSANETYLALSVIEGDDDVKEEIRSAPADVQEEIRSAIAAFELAEFLVNDSVLDDVTDDEFDCKDLPIDDACLPISPCLIQNDPFFEEHEQEKSFDSRVVDQETIPLKDEWERELIDRAARADDLDSVDDEILSLEDDIDTVDDRESDHQSSSLLVPSKEVDSAQSIDG